MSNRLEWTEIEKEHTAPHSPIQAFLPNDKDFSIFTKSQIQRCDVKKKKF